MGGTLDPVTLDPVTLDPVTLDPLIRSGGLIQSPLGMVIVGARPPIVWANQPARRLGDGLAAAAWPGRAPS
jgi:hypothetical protein